MTTLLLLTLTGVMMAVLALAARASADTGQPNPLELSSDGVTWQHDLTAPLFAPAIRWVPGDVRDASFYVRNARPDLGDLEVAVDRTATDALLDTGDMHISARAGDGPWTTVAAGGRQVLVDGDDLGGGDAVKVTLRARMDAAAPNATMVLASDLDLSVTLSQTVTGSDQGSGHDGDNNGGDGSNDGDTNGSSGALPNTGSDLRPWTLPLALALLVSGAVLVVRRKNESEEPLHE